MIYEPNGLIDTRYLDKLDPSATSELLRHTASDQPPSAQLRVFVNRNLRMEKIRYIGFDLDWTLADYHRDAMSEITFELALGRMVEKHGYSREILKAEFRADFARRGLIIDKKTGMVVKMSRHRYVGRAYHGRHFLDADERARLYRREPLNPASARFHFLDTLFEMPEVNIFSELVEMADHKKTLEIPTYAKLFQHIRGTVDEIHADGTLKSEILSHLDRYLPRDERLVLALRRMAMNGRRLLLITNSEWYYTRALCSYLFDGLVPGLDSWRELFDLVIVESKKPGFFRKNGPFIELDANGEPLREVDVPRWDGVYAGGSREGLMKLLDGHGEEVLYVGDHIYGDVVSSKLASTWRTALIVRELEDEITARRNLSHEVQHLAVLRSEVIDLGQRMDDLSDVQALYRDATEDGHHVAGGAALHRTQELLNELKTEHKIMRRQVNRLQSRVSRSLNPYWGSLFKQGQSKSLFGSQVKDFACLYTSRVSNLASYGSEHYFRVLRDAMIHEIEI